MRTSHRILVFPLICFIAIACARKSRAFERKDIDKSFQPLLDFMGVRPGAVLADVGAGSGSLTVAMSSLMENSEVYVQDIDDRVLNREELDMLIDRYTRDLKTDLRKKNTYHVVIGNTSHTGLPDRTFDFIYSNATAHVFDAPDSMFRDMGKKLKPDGLLFVRDCFKNLNGSGSVCSDRSCAKPLFSTADFLAMMERNHFRLVRQSPSMSGYPVFGFDFID